jgi:hypothetical protein
LKGGIIYQGLEWNGRAAGGRKGTVKDVECSAPSIGPILLFLGRGLLRVFIGSFFITRHLRKECEPQRYNLNTILSSDGKKNEMRQLATLEGAASSSVLVFDGEERQGVLVSRLGARR